MVALSHRIACSSPAHGVTPSSVARGWLTFDFGCGAWICCTAHAALWQCGKHVDKTMFAFVAGPYDLIIVLSFMCDVGITF